MNIILLLIGTLDTGCKEIDDTLGLDSRTYEHRIGYCLIRTFPRKLERNEIKYFWWMCQNSKISNYRIRRKLDEMFLMDVHAKIPKFLMIRAEGN